MGSKGPRPFAAGGLLAYLPSHPGKTDLDTGYRPTQQNETAMAHAPSNNPAAVTETAFTADRQRMFNGFCSATTWSVIVSVIGLALMAIFLV